MLGWGSQTVSKTLELTRVRLLPKGHLISSFSLWAMQAAWITTGILAGLMFTIKVFGLLVVQGEYIDPFARYDAIMPGHSIEALASYPCYFHQNREQRLFNELTCVMFPDDEPFDMVFIDIRDEQIEGIAFYATDLQLGQVALRWQGTIKLQTGHTKLTWNTPQYTIEAVGQKLCYKCAVRAITFTNRA